MNTLNYGIDRRGTRGRAVDLTTHEIIEVRLRYLINDKDLTEIEEMTLAVVEKGAWKYHDAIQKVLHWYKAVKEEKGYCNIMIEGFEDDAVDTSKMALVGEWLY